MEYKIIAIIFIHWVADFLLQTDKMATGKSKSNYWLSLHVGVYSLVWLVVGLLFYHPYIVLVFALITFACHFITDYYTSRINSKLWEQKKVHWFFVSVGFDQFLHYAQLILCFKLLTAI